MSDATETLAARLGRGPLSAKQATQICRSLLSILEQHHARGMAHGAIAAETIVFEQGRPTLQGFHQASRETISGDLYALAAVFYQTISGTPWSPGTRPETADWNGIPRRTRRALRKALAVRPDDRFADAAAFQRALWVPRPTPLIWPAAAVLAFAVILIGAIGFCNPLGLCPERSYELMILPFRVEQGARSAIGARLASGAAQKLLQLPNFAVVPGSVAQRMWQDSVAGLKPPRLRVAARAGGSVVERPNLLLVRLEVWDSAGKPRYSTAFSTRPGADTEMVDSVVLQLVRWLRPDLVQAVRPR